MTPCAIFDIILLIGSLVAASLIRCGEKGLIMA